MTDDPECPITELPAQWCACRNHRGETVLPPCGRCWHNARQHGPNMHCDPEPGDPCYAPMEGAHGVLIECLCRGYRQPRKMDTVRVTGDRL